MKPINYINYRNWKNLYVALLFVPLCLYSQNRKKENKLVLGFGGGTNISHIQSNNVQNLYVNLDGSDQNERYSLLFTNFGFHYHFIINVETSNFVIGIQPGTSVYKFERIIPINTSDTENRTNISLNYFKLPLHFIMKFPTERSRPYLGGIVSFEKLNQPENIGSIIQSRVSSGPVAGIQIPFEKFTLDLSSSLLFSLHNLTDKSQRYSSNGSGSVVGQSDIKLHNLNLNLSVLIPIEKSWRISSLLCP